MANDFGTTFVNLIAPEALTMLNTIRPEISMFTTDFSSEQVAWGASVYTRLIGGATVGNFGTGAIDRTDTDVTVTMNLHKEVHNQFLVTQYSASPNRNLVQESALPFAYAIGNSIVDAAAALMTTGFTTNAITEPNAWSYESLVNIRKTMAEAGVPEWGRFFICNSTVYASLLLDSRIVEAMKNPMNQNAIATGKLPMVAGLSISEYPALPTTNNMVAFAGHKDALLVVSRVQTDPRSISGAQYPGNYQVVTNAATGFSVTLNEFITPTLNTLNLRMSWMYGVDEGNTAVGFPIVTA
jgi:hypothetical protein